MFYLFIHFWLSHPALFHGCAFFLGISVAVTPSIWLAFPIGTFFLPFLISGRDVLKHSMLSLLTFLTAWCYAAIITPLPVLPEAGMHGKALVSIQSISLQTSFFGERWIYRCQLRHFIPSNSSLSPFSSVPCTIAFPADETLARPEANVDYWVDGTLAQKSHGGYVLRVSKKAAWIKIEQSSSWAEQRYQWKQLASHWIESNFSHVLSGSFLAGLTTGEFDDTWMRQQFARFGLQHLLAISGFHFAIIAGFLSFIFRFVPWKKSKVSLLLLCLGGYCFFLGPQPSILRAWIMCSLTLIGVIFDKQTTALNSLGFALLAVLMINPWMIRELGFQLSFATTAAILLFTQPTQTWMKTLFPKRTLSHMIEFNTLNQHGYIVLSFLRESLALSFAVNLFALPLTLYYFHQFPWMSLFYNLFFPLLASFSLCLLLLGSLFFFIPPLATVIHALNDGYTYFLLQLTYQVPNALDVYLSTQSLSTGFMILYFTVVSSAGILLKEKFCNRNQDGYLFI